MRWLAVWREERLPEASPEQRCRNLFEFLTKKKKSKGVWGGLDTLWMSGLAVVIFGVVLVIGVRIMGGFNASYSTDYAVNNTNVQAVLSNTMAGLVNLSSWTSLITTVIAGVVILGLIMMVAYIAAPRGGGGTA